MTRRQIKAFVESGYQALMDAFPEYALLMDRGVPVNQSTVAADKTFVYI